MTGSLEKVPFEGVSSVPVTVLLPIAGAVFDLERCLASLEKPAGAPFRLLLILDGPQEPAVERLIHRAEERFQDVGVVRLPDRSGYVEAILAGQEHADPRSDEVWLNSDTELPSGWLACLLEVARSRPRVASVTPWTNSGTLASFPIPFAENCLPRGWEVEALAQKAQQTAREPFPEIPTGVGFCLFVRRDALREVGTLDRIAFAPGYGEEVDWCLRARKFGWCHLLATNTFVYHRGAQSFGRDQRRVLLQRAERRLRRRYPHWQQEVSAFMTQDPLKPERERLLSVLFPRRTRFERKGLRILHVVHGFPPRSQGGTERFAKLLTRAQAEAGHEVAVLSRFFEEGFPNGARLEELAEGVRIRWFSRPFTERNPLSRNALWSPTWRHEVSAFVREFRPQLVHVHHLAALSLDALNGVFAQRIPVVLQLQDWWLDCQRAHRMHRTERPCPKSSAWRCSDCQPLTRLFPARLLSYFAYLFRRQLARRVVQQADLVLTASAPLARDLAASGLLQEAKKIRILPYGVDPQLLAQWRTRRATQGNAPPVVGFLGTLLPHKGLHLLLEAVDSMPKAERPRLRVWGRPVHTAYVERLRLPSRPELLEWREEFEDDQLPDFFAGIDLLVVPSLGLESFGFAAAEALASGVPVLAADSGSLPERVGNGGGCLFPAGHAAALAQELLRLCRCPERLQELSQSAPPAIPFSQTAVVVERCYLELLGSR